MAKNGWRFSTKQLLAALAIAAICLTAYLHYREYQRRALLISVYGSPQAFEALDDCKSLSLYRVTVAPNLNAVYWKVPPVDALVYVGAVPPKTVGQVRTLFMTPENVVYNFRKDFVFRPSLMLQCDENPHQLQVFLDFESMSAGFVIHETQIRFVYFDNFSKELREALADAQENSVSAQK